MGLGLADSSVESWRLSSLFHRGPPQRRLTIKVSYFLKFHFFVSDSLAARPAASTRRQATRAARRRGFQLLAGARVSSPEVGGRAAFAATPCRQPRRAPTASPLRRSAQTRGQREGTASAQGKHRGPRARSPRPAGHACPEGGSIVLPEPIAPCCKYSLGATACAGPAVSSSSSFSSSLAALSPVLSPRCCAGRRAVAAAHPRRRRAHCPECPRWDAASSTRQHIAD